MSNTTDTQEQTASELVGTPLITEGKRLHITPRHIIMIWFYIWDCRSDGSLRLWHPRILEKIGKFSCKRCLDTL